MVISMISPRQATEVHVAHSRLDSCVYSPLSSHATYLYMAVEFVSYFTRFTSFGNCIDARRDESREDMKIVT